MHLGTRSRTNIFQSQHEQCRKLQMDTSEVNFQDTKCSENAAGIGISGKFLPASLKWLFKRTDCEVQQPAMHRSRLEPYIACIIS